MLFWVLLGLFATMIEGNTKNRLPTDHLSSKRTLRSLPCPPHEYHNNGLCCKNCPAGTHVSSHCTKDHGPGTCAPCTPGEDFTAGPNGVEYCLKCRPCRFNDQVQVGECTQTRDYQCQCKANTFCINTCLFCKDCTRCPEGQVVKLECTPTSDTVCERTSSVQLTTIKAPEDARTLDGNMQALAVALPISIGIFGIVVVIFLLYRRQKWKEKKKQAESRPDNYENPHFGNTPETVSFIPEMAPVQEQVNNLQAQQTYAPLGQQDAEDFIAVRSNECGVMECSCEGAKPGRVLTMDPTNPHPPSSEASNRACEIIESKSDKLLTDTEWYDCFDSLKENVPPSSWREMMRHLGLSEVDIESIRLTHSDVREMNYQMFLLWRNQNGHRAAMGKVLRVLDKMNLRGCKENVANSLTSKGIQIA